MTKISNKTGIQYIANPVIIIVLHLVYKQHHIIFERDDRRVGPLSGKVNPGEDLRSAAKRELGEETGLPIDPFWLFHTGHCFHGISPKGKKIFGVSLLAILNHRSFDISKIKLSEELLDYQLVSPEVAISRIQKYGHPESLPGVMCVLKENFAIKNGKRDFNKKGDSYEKEI